VLWPDPTVSVRIVKLAGATGARPKTGSLVEAHSYSLVILNPEKMLLVPGRCAAGQTRETGVRCARLLSASSKKEIKERKRPSINLEESYQQIQNWATFFYTGCNC
jgi:hypothetical protein